MTAQVLVETDRFGETESTGQMGRADGEKTPLPLAKEAMWGEGRRQGKHKQETTVSLDLGSLNFSLLSK